MQSGFEGSGRLAEVVPLAVLAVTLDDVRREVGDRWTCAPVTGGFRGVPRGVRGTPIPRYGRTPAELLESIRHTERQP